MKAPARKRALIRLAVNSLVALPLLLIVSTNALAQDGRAPTKPVRYFTISGQVTLPNGRPASGARLTSFRLCRTVCKTLPCVNTQPR